MTFKKFIVIGAIVALIQAIVSVLRDSDFDEDLNPSPPATNDWDSQTLNICGIEIMKFNNKNFTNYE